MDLNDGNALVAEWSNHPSLTPSVSAAPSDSPTVDQCAQDVCGLNSSCVNSADNSIGYVCSCDDGFQLSGTSSCVDIDECTTVANVCPTTAICSNTQGGYTCTCKDGYWGRKCVDYPECKKKGKNKFDSIVFAGTIWYFISICSTLPLIIGLEKGMEKMYVRKEEGIILGIF